MTKLIKVCKASCICWIKALYKCKVWQTDWLIELDKIDIVWHVKVVWMPDDIIWKIQNTEVNEVWAELSHIRRSHQRDSRFSYTIIQIQKNSKVCPFFYHNLLELQRETLWKIGEFYHLCIPELIVMHSFRKRTVFLILWTEYIIVLLMFYHIGCMKGMVISAVKCKCHLWCWWCL